MKKTLKKALQIGGLLLGIFIVSLACQEVPIDNVQEQVYEKRLQRISLNKFKNRVGNSKDFEKLSKLFDINQENTIQLNRLEQSDNPWLITDEIAMIEKEGVTFYTFRVGTQTESVEFYNFVVSIDDMGNILSTRILEYTPNDIWLQDTTQPFVGEIAIQENDIFSIDNINNLFAARPTSQCLSGVSTYWECNFEKNHYPGHDECTDGTSWEFIITLQYEPCLPSIVQVDAGGSSVGVGYPVDTNPTGQGGGSGASGGPGDLPDNDDEEEDVDDCVPSLTHPCPVDETTILAPLDNEEDEDCDTSVEDLKKIFPNIPDDNAELLASIINDKGQDFGIDSDEDLWHFLSQAGHETGGFNTLQVTESTYWTTASKLAAKYSKFTMDSVQASTNASLYYAPDYLQNSSGVANIAMCCDYGNGNVASGDGYKYRGRGIIQLTWHDNYKDFKTWYNNKYDPDIDPVTTPNLIATNDTLAILSGLWYYKTRVVDAITIDSTTTVRKVTKPINPGYSGIEDRKERFKKAKDSINCL